MNGVNLQKLNNLYEGKMGFAVGSGCSLHYQNLDNLKNFVSIAINAAIVKIPFANFFLTDDHDIQYWNYWYDLIPNINCDLLLYKNKPWNPQKLDHIDKNRIIWFDHKCWYDPIKNKYHPEGLFFTQNPLEPIVGARNSTGSAVHFLYIMGCNPIVLLGCDCCFDGYKKYFWQYDGEDKVEKNSGPMAFTFPVGQTMDYEGKKVDKFFFEFLDYWKALAKQAKQQNIKIIDASGGVLDIFDKMTLEEVIAYYG